MSINRSDLARAAVELNTSMGLDPEIPVKGVSDEALITSLKEAALLVESGDTFSAVTTRVLKSLRTAEPEPEPEPESEDDGDDAEDVDAKPVEVMTDEELLSMFEGEEADETPEEAPAKKRGRPRVVQPEEPIVPAGKVKTLAAMMDTALRPGGTWAEIRDRVETEAGAAGIDLHKCTLGAIRAHARFRISKGSLKIKMTDAGVEVVS